MSLKNKFFVRKDKKGRRKNLITIITIKILLEVGKKFKKISPLDLSEPAPSNCSKWSLLKTADCLLKFTSYTKYFVIG
jgi:hypothetical protein